MGDVDKLLRAAQITKWDFNTRVIRPADKSYRVNVRTGDNPYGDHVQIGICAEPGFPGAPWLVAHFTPARARVIAHHLLEIADAIDPPKKRPKATCDICEKPLEKNDYVVALPEIGNYHYTCYLKKKGG